MNLTEIFTILICHWILDFILQTDKQAKGKSKNWSDLLAHTFTYSWPWVFPMCFLIGVNGTYSTYDLVMKSIIFAIITFIFHTITDYFTSRLNSYLLNRGDHHNFFVSVGFDQLLHYFQLFILFNYLK